MASLPKPPRKEKKAPRPLRRSPAPARKTCVRKKRKGKQARLAAKANQLWSDLVKVGGVCYCVGTGKHPGESGRCAGPLQAAHGFGKKAHPSTRYLPINGFALCARAHKFYTHQPHRWEAFLREAWGTDVYDELFRLACQTAKHDLPAIIAALRAELEGTA